MRMYTASGIGYALRPPTGLVQARKRIHNGLAGWGMVAGSKTDCVGWVNVHWRMHHLGAHLLDNPGKRRGEAWQIMASISTSSRVSPWICPTPVTSMMICWLIVETLESAPPNRLDQSRTFPKLRRILLQMPPECRYVPPATAPPGYTITQPNLAPPSTGTGNPLTGSNINTTTALSPGSTVNGVHKWIGRVNL